MSDSYSSSKVEQETELAARAAWLYFIGGLTQSEVAGRLGISGTRAHRLVVKAQSLGLVHISVDAPAASCVELENTLMDAFDLSICRVAMDLGESGEIPLRALGAIAGNWLDNLLNTEAHGVIGISHGRTIAAMVEAMQLQHAKKTVFVSLLGGLTRSLAANPYDVIHRLAQKLAAEAYLMPAPLFANSPQDKAVLMAQTMLNDAFARMQNCDLAIVGIGDMKTSIGALAIERDQTDMVQELRDKGAVAEMLGQFLDRKGRQISTSLDGCEIAMPLDELRGRNVVAIAGGLAKADAIRAALRSGLLTGLMIDEPVARKLVEDIDGKKMLS